MITIVLEGGLVQAIVSEDPAQHGTPVMIIDYDCEGAEEDELVFVPQNGDYSPAQAVAYRDTVNEAGIDIASVIKQLEEKL